jgi:hypothetical protein
MRPTGWIFGMNGGSYGMDGDRRPGGMWAKRLLSLSGFAAPLWWAALKVWLNPQRHAGKGV